MPLLRPAVVGEIRNDVLRQIGMPLAASPDVANNTFLHASERDALAEAGMPAWVSFAGKIKDIHKAATVFWASGTRGTILTKRGYDRMLSKSNPCDAKPAANWSTAPERRWPNSSDRCGAWPT